MDPRWRDVASMIRRLYRSPLKFEKGRIYPNVFARVSTKTPSGFPTVRRFVQNVQWSRTRRSSETDTNGNEAHLGRRGTKYCHLFNYAAAKCGNVSALRLTVIAFSQLTFTPTRTSEHAFERTYKFLPLWRHICSLHVTLVSYEI